MSVSTLDCVAMAAGPCLVPERLVSAACVIADEDVFNGEHRRVAHVERARHMGAVILLNRSPRRPRSRLFRYIRRIGVAAFSHMSKIRGSCSFGL